MMQKLVNSQYNENQTSTFFFTQFPVQMNEILQTKFKTRTSYYAKYESVYFFNMFGFNFTIYIYNIIRSF